MSDFIRPSSPGGPRRYEARAREGRPVRVLRPVEDPTPVAPRRPEPERFDPDPVDAEAVEPRDTGPIALGPSLEERLARREQPEASRPQQPIPVPPPKGPKRDLVDKAGGAALGFLRSLKEFRKRLPRVKAKMLVGPGLLLIAFTLMGVFFSLVGGLRPLQQGTPIKISAVDRMARAHQIAEATFYDEDATIILTDRYGTTFYTRYPKSDAITAPIVDRLFRSGAEVNFDQQTGKAIRKPVIQFLLPLLILAALFSFFFLLITGQSGGAAEFFQFSKVLARVTKRKKGKGAVTFDDVAAVDEAIIELQEVVEYLMNPGKFEAMGAKAPKGVLLVGPPGTGKTLLARAVAGEANVPFFSMAGSEFVEALVGVGAARVRDLFRKGRDNAPCMIFIDELDAAGRQRGAGVGQGNDEREQTLNQMLAEMDGFDVSAGIVVMGATNRPDILDPALLRPGRFDRQVVIDVPDLTGRNEILKVHARGRPMVPDADLLAIAKQTPGFTGADLANIMNEAALLAVRRGHQGIDNDDLDEAVERTIAGPERRSHILSDHEKLLVAHHEAGHAIVARAVGQQVGIQKLSIVARGRQLGHATVYMQADKLVLLRSEIEAQLTALLGGLAAENLVFGEVSTGSKGDLDQATDLARKMVATWGMSEEVGRLTVQREGAQYLGRDAAAMSLVSQAILERIDHQMYKLLDDAEKRAEHILKQYRALMDEIVRVLLERESMNHEEVQPFLEPVRPVVIGEGKGMGRTLRAASTTTRHPRRR